MLQAVKTNKRPDGYTNWEAVANLIDGRTANQCAIHHGNLQSKKTAVRPTKTGKWSAEEDRILEQAVKSNRGGACVKNAAGAGLTIIPLAPAL